MFACALLRAHVAPELAKVFAWFWCLISVCREGVGFWIYLAFCPGPFSLAAKACPIHPQGLGVWRQGSFLEGNPFRALD